ncbi:type I-F CRISPR-associated protein Csy1 [Aliidiomarina taiwanensis]|uniref:Type I-F CRISPR-associated protein Csy1 n=1 Tax=Aliidiomarina taiwanensis TaxID=946228 RepID=A0A432X7H2_9GAMM|nr:type I-F CRISPR-associated protein Csy1 [Aliidiomarina taiwanensis]RUO42766.1 type I-F CRISPR-associated protein Csy1 [Aliidiomarina taiwanensis]
MEAITTQQVKEAINTFLTEQYDKKTETQQKQLLKAKEQGDYEKIADLNEKLSAAKRKYQLETWMADAANRMANQLHFGTHISKGIHPDAKGDNVTFIDERQSPYVGTHSIDIDVLDANGNAAALPLFAFFNQQVKKGVKIGDLIIEKHAATNGVFSEKNELSDTYLKSFYSALTGSIKKPATHERNKQLLWPIAEHDYNVIVPLYPSVFTYYLYNKINDLRYSDENKSARDNRFKKTAEQKPYVSLSNTAVVQLGGTKPQNISSLMSKQGGRNYLLPSLPPKYQQTEQFKIPTYANSIFDKALDYRCKDTFKALVRLIETQYNNVNIRKARRAILDDLLFQVFSIASSIQQQYLPGWSQNFALNYSEKLWLDPQRCSIEGEETFKQDRDSNNWQADISKRFASWVNSHLRRKLKNIKHDFADAEHTEWQREMDDMISQSQRSGQGVFL